ncbi:MAG: PTS sugar transporter subunit IIC [Ruminococcaceae bacterium]|nr:PTS sugar transporter subunit IIC [Oscillospiraceae bacterium]
MKKIFTRYFIDGLGAMAQGLFATLIIGTILSQIGKFVPAPFGTYIILAANVAKSITGAGIAVAVAAKFKASPLVSASAAAIGMLGAFAGTDLSGISFGAPGEPLGAFVAAVVAIEVGMLVSGKTKLDIIVAPVVSICSGAAAAFLISTPIASFMSWLGSLVNYNVEKNPVIGGIIVAVLMGMILTLPISSAAIGISLGLSGIAAGAACVGCCCQMIGFAVISYRDNGVGGLISQGLGTSMLQVPNIMKKPVIWLAPICSSAILGPVASALVKMTNTPTGSGMGSAGLVGQFEAFTSMQPQFGSVWTLVLIAAMHFVLPALVTLGFDAIFVKLGWVRKGDMKLSAR